MEKSVRVTRKYSDGIRPTPPPRPERKRKSKSSETSEANTKPEIELPIEATEKSTPKMKPKANRKKSTAAKDIVKPSQKLNTKTTKAIKTPKTRKTRSADKSAKMVDTGAQMAPARKKRRREVSPSSEEPVRRQRAKKEPRDTAATATAFNKQEKKTVTKANPATKPTKPADEPKKRPTKPTKKDAEPKKSASEPKVAKPRKPPTEPKVATPKKSAAERNGAKSQKQAAESKAAERNSLAAERKKIADKPTKLASEPKAAQPKKPVTKSKKYATEPKNPATKPKRPAVKTKKPTTVPKKPNAKPNTPVAVAKKPVATSKKLNTDLKKPSAETNIPAATSKKSNTDPKKPSAETKIPAATSKESQPTYPTPSRRGRRRTIESVQHEASESTPVNPEWTLQPSLQVPAAATPGKRAQNETASHLKNISHTTHRKKRPRSPVSDVPILPAKNHEQEVPKRSRTSAIEKGMEDLRIIANDTRRESLRPRPRKPKSEPVSRAGRTKRESRIVFDELVPVIRVDQLLAFMQHNALNLSVNNVPPVTLQPDNDASETTTSAHPETNLPSWFGPSDATPTDDLTFDNEWAAILTDYVPDTPLYTNFFDDVFDELPDLGDLDVDLAEFLNDGCSFRDMPVPTADPLWDREEATERPAPTPEIVVPETPKQVLELPEIDEDFLKKVIMTVYTEITGGDEIQMRRLDYAWRNHRPYW